MILLLSICQMRLGLLPAHITYSISLPNKYLKERERRDDIKLQVLVRHIIIASLASLYYNACVKYMMYYHRLVF